MTGTRALFSGLLLALVLAAPAVAQQAPTPQARPAEQLTVLTQADADRATLRSFLARDEVRTVAQIARVDLDAATAAVMTMDSDRLANAAQQARVIDQQITAQDRITLKVTTIIIALLLLIIILIAV